MKTSDFPSVREARLTVEKHMERYKKLMGIKKGKTMIELPRLNSVSVMTSNVGSTHMTPREDYVRLSDARTYGDQRAAEARELMREECIAICDSHAESCEELKDTQGMKTADRIADEIRKLK